MVRVCPMAGRVNLLSKSSVVITNSDRLEPWNLLNLISLKSPYREISKSFRFGTSKGSILPFFWLVGCYTLIAMPLYVTPLLITLVNPRSASRLPNLCWVSGVSPLCSAQRL